MHHRTCEGYACPCLGERLGLCLTEAIQAPSDRREYPRALRRGHASRLGTLNHQLPSLHLVYCLTSIAFCNSCILFTSHNECHTWLRHHLQVNFFVLMASHRPLHLSGYPTTFERCNAIYMSIGEGHGLCRDSRLAVDQDWQQRGNCQHSHSCSHFWNLLHH